MKKKILVSVALMALLVSALCACGKKLTPGDATVLYNPKDEGMEIVKDEVALDVMNKAFTYYKNCNQYKMHVDFVFNASPNFAYQVTEQTIIRNNDEYYEEYIVMGTGGAKEKNKGSQFYYKGGRSKAKYIDEKNMTIDKDKNIVTADFSGANWSSFNATLEKNPDIKSASDKVNLSKEKFHQYKVGKEYLAKTNDSNVYKKGDKYYCSININTLEMANDTYQTAVVKAIEVATGGSLKEFKENTRMVAELEKSEGEYRFTQFILMEDYVGKVTLGVELTVSQQYWHKFYYDAESVKIEDLIA